MIPKKIHYCWFGKGELPLRERRCIASWKKHMPNFELVLWNETNFDVETCAFTSEAYKYKKYAFVSDYVRLYALVNYGGIYLDTDVEILKPFSEFVVFDAFGSFETPNVIQTGVIASIPNGVLVTKMFQYYKNKTFVLKDGTLNQVANSRILTDILLEDGLVLNNLRQSLSYFELFPTEYFCPINQATQEIEITENTYCIHYLSGSWMTRKNKITRKLKSFIGKVFGFKTVKFIRKIIVNK